MSEPLWASVAFAAGAGAATFLSPCALPLVPGYVGFYLSAAGGQRPGRGLAVRALAVAAGVLATLGGLAGLAVLVGRPVVRALPAAEPIVGAGLLALGLGMVTDRLPGWRVSLPERRADAVGFALFGAGYAGASAGCVLPVFLAVVLQAAALSPAAAAVVLGTYAGTVAVPLLAVTVALGAGVDVATGRLAAFGDHAETTAGLVLVAAGAGQLLVGLGV
jgi:cytochrome c-type biogenesis protein